MSVSDFGRLFSCGSTTACRRKSRPRMPPACPGDRYARRYNRVHKVSERTAPVKIQVPDTFCLPLAEALAA